MPEIMPRPPDVALREEVLDIGVLYCKRGEEFGELVTNDH